MKTETDIAKHLKPLSFSDFDLVQEFVKKYPCESCDFNICNLFTWSLFYKLQYTIYQDRLVLFNPAFSYMLFPIGERFSAEELLELSSRFKKTNENVEIFAVCEDYINRTNAREYFNITEDENWSDYIYMAEDLVKLPGKKLAKKKNLISQFKRLYTDFELKPITANDRSEIMDFCYYWRKIHDAENNYLDVEFQSIKTILTHWDLFPCNGLKLYVDGKICAFAVYSPQTPEMATVHFEKYDPTMKGAGQVINQETAKIIIKDFKYINREEDMGLAGLRQAKRSYQPERMLRYFKLKGK